MQNSQTMASLRDRDSLRKEDKMPVPKVSFVRRLDCSDRCQACVRCMEGVRISEGPLWEVSLYNVHFISFLQWFLQWSYLLPRSEVPTEECSWCHVYDYGLPLAHRSTCPHSNNYYGKLQCTCACTCT